MEYKGFEIRVRSEYVVLGSDPMVAATSGFMADVCTKDPIQGPDGRVMWDYPFGMAASLVQGATVDEVVDKAKAFIDAGGKVERDPLRPREA
jgi:hypothetical protein